MSQRFACLVKHHGGLRSACLLELKLQSELQIALRVATAVSRVRDDSRMGIGASRIPDKGVGLVQVNVIEEIHCLNAELQFRAFSKTEFLE